MDDANTADRQDRGDDETNKPRRTGARGGPIELGLLPSLIGYNLRCAQVTVFQHYKEAMGGHGISAPQFGTMLLIEANPGVSQSSVAEALRFDRSTLVQIIDRLEGRGLVVREVSAQDRRSHALRLTDQGTDLLAELKDLAVSHEEAVLRSFSEEERRALITLLERVHSPETQ
jgi:DNA-binding MarR family transcriptional regulator